MTNLNVDYQNQPSLIEKLNEQDSLVNLNISQREVQSGLDDKTSELRWLVGIQVRVNGKVNLNSVVNQMISDKFTQDEREAAIRKGILDNTDHDYVAFNNYAEYCKQICRENGLQ